MPMQAPPCNSVIARFSAPTSPVPRSIGICPIPSSTLPNKRFLHSEDFVSAWIWRRCMAAVPIAIGSQ
jgi:hypothetical protein